MESSLNFTLTGFRIKKYEQQIKESLFKLGCNFIQKLSQITNILIVSNTATQKFKIAKLNKNPIPCVTKKWVQDCKKSNSLLPPDNYLIGQKQMFLGVEVAVCGFAKDKLQKIQKIIKQRGGNVITKYKAAQINRDYSEILQDVDVILASQQQIQRAKHAKIPKVGQFLVPLVRVQWLEDSLKKKRCKFPNDYAVNKISNKPFLAGANKLNQKLKNFIQTNDIMDKSTDFLRDTVIYFDKQIVTQQNLFKNLLAVCGGYWMDQFRSFVTHVLVAQIDEKKYQQYRKYGTRIQIVRAEWLIDSILLYNRLQQEDYVIRSFKINNQYFKTLIAEQFNRNNQNSQNFNSLPAGLTLDRRMSMNSNPIPLQLQSQKKKSSVQLKTTIFEDMNFYFPQQIINEPHYIELRKTINLAGGLAYDKINSKTPAFVPLRDSPNVKSIIDKINQANYVCIVVSERWVKQCIKKNTFINPNLKQNPAYFPYNFKTPFTEFHKFVFELVGYQPGYASKLRQLIVAFGSTKVNPNKKQVTHILCGSQWTNNESRAKISKIKSQNSKALLINDKWLQDCIKEGKVIGFEDYILKEMRKQQLQTPEKKSEVQNSGSDNKTTIPECKIDQNGNK